MPAHALRVAAGGGVAACMPGAAAERDVRKKSKKKGLGAGAEVAAEPLVLGRFAPGEVLGRGAFFVVRAGRDVQTGQPVALKAFAPQLLRGWPADKVAACFRAELAAFRAVAPVAGVVELLASSSPLRAPLTTVLERGAYTLEWSLEKRTLSWADRGACAAQLATALVALHGLGRVHNDVKPANAMWFARPRQWKLIDIAGLVPSGTELPVDPPFWTPLFAAPGIARAALRGGGSVPVLPAFDTWALGVVLLDLLAVGRFEEHQCSLLAAALLDFAADPGPDPWLAWLATAAPVRVEDFAEPEPGDPAQARIAAAAGAALAEPTPAVAAVLAALRPPPTPRAHQVQAWLGLDGPFVDEIHEALPALRALYGPRKLATALRLWPPDVRALVGALDREPAVASARSLLRRRDVDA